VRDRDAYANLLLPKLLAQRQLTGRDAAFATELAYGTLRGQGTYDAILAACSDRPLAKLDPPVLDVLRLGAHQLLNTRVGPHAAVATSVDLAKSVIGPRVSGYVNAVLRRVATRDLDAWLAIVAPDQVTDPDAYLATRYSHPRWIVAAYRAALGDAADAAPRNEAGPVDSQGGLVYSSAHSGVQNYPPAASTDPDAPVSGAENAQDAGPTTRDASPAAGVAPTELEAALAAGNARPRVTMATFPSGQPREAVIPTGAAPGRWSPYAFTLESGDPTPLIESALAIAQDEGSQLAAIALSRAPVAPRRGSAGDGPSHAASGGPGGGASDGGAELWLDMCAGPGGKSRLLYGLAGSKARLIAAELHPHRAALVKAALEHTGESAGRAPRTDEAERSGGRAPVARTTVGGTLSSRPAARSSSGMEEDNSKPGERGYAVLISDGTQPAWPENSFDRVLLDVPCSGLGALRRRPEARWRKSLADLKDLTALQRDLLRSALRAVRPGGVVAYVTCSPVPAETTDVVTDVAQSTPGIELLDTPQVLAEVPAIAAQNPKFAQLWPHRHGTDAIFIALLRRSTGGGTAIQMRRDPDRA
jgi:16S rRNA (cytosine967-C5)-methyltransferase